jgi:hypothetical protein
VFTQIQWIKNEFTVDVYEKHARIALEKVLDLFFSLYFLFCADPCFLLVLQGDLAEYNQCQSQLRELYREGLPGHDTEFAAYRILYLLMTRNRTRKI